MAKITNAGELRTFLANAMIGVKDGVLDVAEAKQIMGLADSINESFYSEIKVARVRSEMNSEKFRAHGTLTLAAEPDAPK